MQHLTKAEHPTNASAHKQGVQGGTPWAFSVPFCAQKGTPRRIGGPSGEDTPQGVALTDYKPVGVQAVRIEVTHPPSDGR